MLRRRLKCAPAGPTSVNSGKKWSCKSLQTTANGAQRSAIECKGRIQADLVAQIVRTEGVRSGTLQTGCKQLQNSAKQCNGVADGCKTMQNSASDCKRLQTSNSFIFVL